jgi:hypothetical protein
MSGDGKDVTGSRVYESKKQVHVTFTIAQWKRKFFANSSFLIFQNSQPQRQGSSDLKGAAYEA